MTHSELIKHFGNGSKAAEALGFTRQAVSRWKRDGIPYDTQKVIEMRTKGKLKATFTERMNERLSA